jgi:predicted Rossmann-fold nucleotide-binding protein
MFGIMSEFVEATERLAAIRPAVTIFGSARIKPGSPYYELTEKIARKLSDAGFSVISGGGPGIMEAANKGAFFGKSPSVGLNIQLPHEQRSTLPGHLADLPPLLRAQVHVRALRQRLRRDARRFRHARRADGGADPDPDRQGAQDSDHPGLLGFLAGPARLVQGRLVEEKMIDPEDINLIQVIDEPEKVVEAIFKHYESRPFGPLPNEREMMLNL